MEQLDIESARERLRLGLRPRIALVNLAAAALGHPADPEDRIAVTGRIAHNDANGPLYEVWRARMVATVTALDADADIRALRQRLFSAGIASAFGPHDDGAGLQACLVLSARRPALHALETLAADDAGILDPAERAAAAEKFRTYMLRNHHPEWEEKRRQHPDVGDSPYTPREEWTLLGT
ncbi:MAG: hypothetical protein C0520_07135 [Sphingopyxis sp.]|nr:hypothetical protein [Sphingopyxis sp.]